MGCVLLRPSRHPGTPAAGRQKDPGNQTRVDDATTDTTVIRSWWDHWPSANIGLATGHKFDVLDVDTKAGRPGAESFDQLERAGLTQGAWGTAATPSGGRHVLFMPYGDGNHSDGASGLDFRGRGGFIVAPPSHTVEIRKPSGGIDQHEGTYQWEASDPDARGRPFDWQSALAHLRGTPPTVQVQHQTSTTPTTPKLAGLLRKMAAAQPGERNSILYWCGRRLAEAGYGPTSADALATIARETGLGDHEIRNTLRSAGVAS